VQRRCGEKHGGFLLVGEWPSVGSRLLIAWSDSWNVATVETEVPMICNFEKICLLFDKKLDISEQLEVLSHLDHCDICLEAARQIRRDRDVSLYVQQKLNRKVTNGSAGKRRIRTHAKYASTELNSRN
jgi:hypothetical protein